MTPIVGKHASHEEEPPTYSPMETEQPVFHGDKNYKQY